MNKKDLLELMGLPDAFCDFQPIENTTLWGWNGGRSIFPALVQQLRPQLVIEVGSWMGQSAANLASSCKALGLESTPVICIDTWLGSKEHWRDPNLQKHLELKNGYPTFYQRFLTNMVNADVQDRVIPLPMPSQIAASFLKDFNIQANLAYIDGSHDEKDVYNDLLAYWDLLAPGAVLFGDDWGWDGVSSAVKAFCAEKGCLYSIHEINWLIRK